MPYDLFSPANSFVQFDETGVITSCGFKPITECLPVYYADDVAFQFIVQADTEAEADALCGPYGIRPSIGLTEDCITMDLEFEGVAETFRMDETHVLFQWSDGFPGFDSVYQNGDCFNIMIVLDGQSFCSNCFYRIGGLCYTTRLEYSNNDNFAGFNYCSGGNVPTTDSGCDEEIVTFSNESNRVIPYTAQLLARFGNVPQIQVWIYDTNGELVDMGIRVALDSYPPTELRFDFGGNASGVIRISN